MQSQFLVIHPLEFNPNPSLYTNIWWVEIFVRRGLQERCLIPGFDRHIHGYVPIVMMVVREHGENFLGDKKGGFPVRKLFRTPRQS